MRKPIKFLGKNKGAGKDEPLFSSDEVMTYFFTVAIAFATAIWFLCLYFFRKEAMFVTLVVAIAYAVRWIMNHWFFDKKVFEEAGVELSQ